MDYCSGIWGCGNSEMCQKIQQRAFRFYLGVYPKTPLLALEGDTGWIHPNVRRHTKMLRFWNRVLIQYKVETFEYLNNREMFVHIMKYEWKLLCKYVIKAWAQRSS